MGATFQDELCATYGALVGMDEVGRGSLAGPVAVGAVLVDRAVGPCPDGLTDSKALSAQRRMGLVEPIQGWARAYAVGWASASEIDQWGIIVALRLAGRRALVEVASQVEGPLGVVLLDGSHDWLSAPRDLLSLVGDGPDLPGGPDIDGVPVVTRVKADADCSAVSAASVLAKVARDAFMCDLEDPGYGWASNKGYASAAHIAGLQQLGVHVQHRRSWRLPGVDV